MTPPTALSAVVASGIRQVPHLRPPGFPGGVAILHSFRQQAGQRSGRELPPLEHLVKRRPPSTTGSSRRLLWLESSRQPADRVRKPPRFFKCRLATMCLASRPALFGPGRQPGRAVARTPRHQEKKPVVPALKPPRSDPGRQTGRVVARTPWFQDNRPATAVQAPKPPRSQQPWRKPVVGRALKPPPLKTDRLRRL